MLSNYAFCWVYFGDLPKPWLTVGNESLLIFMKGKLLTFIIDGFSSILAGRQGLGKQFGHGKYSTELEKAGLC